MWRTAAGTWAIDTTHAEAAGLTCRPLRDIVADTWGWLRAGGQPVAAGRRALHGLTPEREAALLAEWDAAAPPPDPAGLSADSVSRRNGPLIRAASIGSHTAGRRTLPRL
jgi:hypothetical protein